MPSKGQVSHLFMTRKNPSFTIYLSCHAFLFGIVLYCMSATAKPTGGTNGSIKLFADDRPIRTCEKIAPQSFVCNIDVSSSPTVRITYGMSASRQTEVSNLSSDDPAITPIKNTLKVHPGTGWGSLDPGSQIFERMGPVHVRVRTSDGLAANYELWLFVSK